MCGIAGLFFPRGNPQAGQALSAMLDVMPHRGPDGRGTWSSVDGRYHAGFVRLAIIDLATGDQPIVEDGGRRVLIGNGEVYNYRELRQRPECAGYPFRTQGDMEPILPLAEALGDDFVHELNGMYGLALYQDAPRRLLLVRDRLGVKPVYWARLPDDGIIFASEIKALFASGLVTPEVCEDGVAAYLAHGWVPAPRTLWRGINKLPPGHLLSVDAEGAITVSRYWRPTPSAALPADAEGIRLYLTDLLKESVRLQLRSDVPLGALLSGGIDSGLLVALAAGQMDRPLNTYTVRFQGATVDESPLAALVAQRYGTRHTCFDLSMADIGRHLPRLAWSCDDPIGDASLLPNQLIEDVLGREVRVALNGTGGDELFAGYGRYFPLAVETRYLRLPAWMRHGVIEPMAGMIAPMTRWRLARAAKFITDGGGYLHDHTTLFPPPIRTLIGNRQAPGPVAQSIHYRDHDGPAQSAALYADLMTYLPEDLLTLLDRTSMAASVEGRVPFLDHRLVEAALAVPPQIRTPHGRQKALERAMAEPFLPTEVLNAPKQGFASPVPAWLKSGLAGPARRLLTSRRSLERGWWTRRGIERLLADPHRHGHRVYALLMLELTIRIHAEDRLTRVPTDSLEAFIDD